MKTGIVNQWDKKRVKYIFREIDERSRDGKETLLSVSEYYGVRPRSESFGDAEFLSRAETLEGYKKCAAGDLVINIMLAWKRGLGVTPVDGIVSPAYNVFRLRQKDACPEFYHYLLRTDEYLAEFTRRSTGIMASRLRMYPDSFMDVRVQLPPTTEQRKIAAYLHEATAKVDQLVKLRERQMELLQEQRAALIQQAVTRGLNPRASLKDSGLPWLGQIPKHWKTTQVRRISSFVTSGSRGWAEFYSDSGDIFVQSGNLTRNMTVDLKNAQRVQPPAGAEGERTLIAQDDVLICVTGGLTGNVAYVDFPPPTAYINQHVALVRSRQNLVAPKFLATALWSVQGQTQFKLAEYGGTKQGLSLDDVRLAWIALPPRPEQTEILDFIQKESAQIDRLLSTYTRQIELLTEYRAALIHECVTGQRALPAKTKEN